MHQQHSGHRYLQALQLTGQGVAFTSLGAILAIPMLVCGGGRTSSGDHAGQVNGFFRITPDSATVLVDQTVSFSASSSRGGDATWSVLPATGGSIDAHGRFTASSSPGLYQIVAMWNSDVRYTATALVTVLPSLPPTPVSLGMVQAFGNHQGSGTVRNTPVAGEPVLSQVSTDSTEVFQLRHGFYLPPPN